MNLKKTDRGGGKESSPIVRPVAASSAIGGFFLEDRKTEGYHNVVQALGITLSTTKCGRFLIVLPTSEVMMYMSL